MLMLPAVVGRAHCNVPPRRVHLVHLPSCPWMAQPFIRRDDARFPPSKYTTQHPHQAWAENRRMEGRALESYSSPPILFSLSPQLVNPFFPLSGAAVRKCFVQRRSITELVHLFFLFCTPPGKTPLKERHIQKGKGCKCYFFHFVMSLMAS